MPITVVNHPVVAHYLTHLRDSSTKPALFRTLARKLASLLAFEASRDLRTASLSIQTPLQEMWSPVLDEEIVVVPILRAGLSMLDSIVELFPDVSVGYIGMERDETTAVANSYYCKLPPLQGRTVFVVDPMLATGGTAIRAVRSVREGGAARVCLLCIVAAPEGVRALEAEAPDVHIYTAALDRELNARKFILPGLGDFGDRLYGTG